MEILQAPEAPELKYFQQDENICESNNMRRKIVRVYEYIYDDDIHNNNHNNHINNQDIYINNHNIYNNSQYIHNNSHINIDTKNSNEHKCINCFKSFDRNWSLKRHMESCQGIKDPLSCEYCHKRFSHEKSRFGHYKICEIKNKKEDEISNLNEEVQEINQNINNTNKEYKCNKCQKYLYTNWYLKKHMKKCQGIKDPLSCEYCHKRFTHEKSRYKHFRICEIKNKKDDDISNLNEEVEEKTNIIEDIPKESIGIIKKKKQAISATIKRLVWNTHIGEEIGKSKCLCCKVTDITQLSFNCGHIIAEANNGKTIVSNLKPICQNCNSSMGTKNMDDFMKTLM